LCNIYACWCLLFTNKKWKCYGRGLGCKMSGIKEGSQFPSAWEVKIDLWKVDMWQWYL